MTSLPDLFVRLESMSAKYPAHTFDFTLDVTMMVKELSAGSRWFFLYGNEHKGQTLTVEQLYVPRWCDDPDLVKEFDKLSEHEKLEVLCLYTVPIHEFRHHADMTLTPFGAHFYFSLAQEYLDFQNFSPFLLQSQELIQPGPLKELDVRLEALGQAVPKEWQQKWAAFKKQVLTFEACTDLRGMNPIWNAAVRNPETVARVLGMEFEQVTVNGLAASFGVKDKPDWYMRAVTLLEGRAVIASLLWIMWNLEGYPELGRILCHYISTLYPRDENYDYRCLLDIAAVWMGVESIEEGIIKHEAGLVRNILHMVDAAAWFALHGAMKTKQGQAVHENFFMRFIYALQEMEIAYDRDYGGPPVELLSRIEQLKRAQDLGFVPLRVGVQSTLQFIKLARERSLTQIWQADIRAHFGYIFDQLEKALSLRLRQGYVTPFAAAYHGNPILYVDGDHRFLLEPYKPNKWVREWFRFRNESIFTPTGPASKRKHLAAQFGLAALVIPCDCGVLISAAVPKWRVHHRVVCSHCGRAHDLSAEDIRYIAEPDESEE